MGSLGYEENMSGHALDITVLGLNSGTSMVGFPSPCSTSISTFEVGLQIPALGSTLYTTPCTS